VKRVSVVGNAGAGKTWLGRRIAHVLGVPFVELDAIHHLAGWEPIDPGEFLARITAMAATDAWVIDGDGRPVVLNGPVWQRADTVVWLDLPRPTVMVQVTLCTLRRTVRREELWNGNRERIRNLWTRDPHKSTVRWAWTQHAKYQRRLSSAMAAPAFDHLPFVRLRSRAVAVVPPHRPSLGTHVSHRVGWR
jgi:adenylate kinase family enzyme